VMPFTLPRIETSSLGADACAIGGAMILHHAQQTFDERIVYGGTNLGTGGG